MKLLKKIDKNLERWVMFLLLAGMTLVLGIQIFCRFVLNNSLTWSEELARFMFIWSTFLSIGFCLKEGISLKIDTLISLFPKKVQAVILLLGDVVMTVFSSICSPVPGSSPTLQWKTARPAPPAGYLCILSRAP